MSDSPLAQTLAELRRQQHEHAKEAEMLKRTGERLYTLQDVQDAPTVCPDYFLRALCYSKHVTIPYFKDMCDYYCRKVLQLPPDTASNFFNNLLKQLTKVDDYGKRLSVTMMRFNTVLLVLGWDVEDQVLILKHAETGETLKVSPTNLRDQLAPIRQAIKDKVTAELVKKQRKRKRTDNDDE